MPAADVVGPVLTVPNSEADTGDKPCVAAAAGSGRVAAGCSANYSIVDYNDSSVDAEAVAAAVG